MATAESSSTYVIELVSEHGRRRCILGSGNDCENAHKIYDQACREFPHTRVRMRQGKQTIALRIPQIYVHEPQGSEH
jgi:hypothetical protein